MKKLFAHRNLIQAIAALLSNLHLWNFFIPTIYQGKLKAICVPGLNCYSCPGATGSCPIGAIQAVVGGKRHNFTYYVVGLILLMGVVLGRLICGFLCIFGWIQDLLYKIPTPKLTVPKSIDKPLRWLKYLFLLGVFLLPVLLKNQFGIGSPYFCKLICPSGTLLGGVPLMIGDEGLRALVGPLFSWKFSLLVLTIAASIFIYRPFCKYICPLGAFYSLFNRISFFQMSVDKAKCNGCKQCERACKMKVEVTKEINALECIRCGECTKVCKQGAISGCFRVKKQHPGEQNSIQ